MRKLLLLASFLFVGCTTIGPAYTPAPPPPQGKALVYLLFSTPPDYLAFYPMNISVNDAKVVGFVGRGYSWIHLNAGSHKFTAARALVGSPVHLYMPVESGKEYFVLVTEDSTVAPGRGGAVATRIGSVQPAPGRNPVMDLSYKEADNMEPQKKF